MVRWKRELALKHADLNSNLQHQRKKLGVAGCVYKPTQHWEAETGRPWERAGQPDQP